MTATSWDRRRATAVAVGAAAGAAVRWLVLALVHTGGGVPWPVLAVNVVGSFVLGVLLAEESRRRTARIVLHDGGAIGFCGGLTTFSTYAVEVADLFRTGDAPLAITYAVLSVVLSLGAVVAGAALLRRLRALSLPLEEHL